MFKKNQKNTDWYLPGTKRGFSATWLFEFLTVECSLSTNLSTK